MDFVVYTIRLSLSDAEALTQIARHEDRRRADMVRALIRRHYRQLTGAEPTTDDLKQNAIVKNY